tara:strand:- start:2 stop:898 length:897 start_codon:yes stop_codon:yes gene_type:complete
MAENLGRVDVVVSGDDAQITAAYKKAAEAFSKAAKVNVTLPGEDGTPGGGGGGGAAGQVAMLGMLPRIGGVIGKFLKFLGPWGIAAAVLLGAFTLGLKKAINTINKWNNELKALTARTSAFNASAAMAVVVTEMGQMFRTMGEGRVFGETTLRLAQLKEQIKNNIQPLKDVWQAIKIGVLERFFEVMERITGMLETVLGPILSLIDQFGGMLGWALDWIGYIVGFFHTGTGLAIQTIAAAIGGLEKHAGNINQEMVKGNDRNLTDIANRELLQSMERLSEGAWTQKHGYVPATSRVVT